ncbi:helix-hairpin-helix domain-containing protein [Ferruginibacter paludis]|uniref:helix-hairpin-helix domain-containing protein n=1 Tax=Ferruginibacter paludis TaxID=1310417 RepID=UPI0025B2845D|nr:helix-hairpin-helix domain-containing protein [Ferruginibacter paludis]MDN3657662.1 helix-hairpin-helix domain-containing protein [Ferruginibacter paludis]
MKQADTTFKYARRNVDKEDYLNYREPEYNRNHPNKAKGDLFVFDPNTLDESGWKRLGIRDKIVATIQKFIEKGGRFYKAEDLGKIWGLHEDEVQRLIPFVQIKQANKEAVYEKKQYENKVYEKPKYLSAAVDINTADTTALIALPGIGSKLSQRIVAFRDKLGGFYKVDQIAETYGLPDSVFQKIKSRFIVDATAVHQINVNTATADEMKTHPYLRYAIANAIVQYRTQHGNFSSVEELKKIMLITEDIYNKTAPYVKVN